MRDEPPLGARDGALIVRGRSSHVRTSFMRAPNLKLYKCALFSRAAARPRAAVSAYRSLVELLTTRPRINRGDGGRVGNDERIANGWLQDAAHQPYDRSPWSRC